MQQVVGHEIGTAIRTAVPPELIPLFVAITHLGATAFLFVLFTFDYWFGDRKRGAHALGVFLAGMALVVALKSFFAQPRPPDSIAAIGASGYSFPSGHAMQSTIGYGLLAYDLKWGTMRQRFGVAAVVAALVSLSRVVLGVHYVRDVVAGVVIAAAFLVVACRLTGRAPDVAFLLAAAVGTVALLVSGASHSGLAVFGGSVAAAVAWRWLDSVPPVETRSGRAVLAVGVLPFAAAVAYVALRTGLPDVFVAPLIGVVTASLLSGPALVGRVVGT